MSEKIDFIAEILREAEEADEKKRIEMDRLRADQLLAAVAVLEGQMADVNDIVEKETRILEEYRSNELARLDKKRAWLLFNLEAYARATGEKTMRLPHGVLRLRKGRDRVAVVSMEKLLQVAGKFGLVRTVPESVTPDNQAILNRIKSTGEIPAGIEYIPADVKFTYSTNGETNGERERDAEAEG